MALVTHINRDTKTRNTIHEPTDCNCYIFTDKDGGKYLQLDTYGSSDRAIPGKTSQSIQFDEAAIKQLIKILAENF